MRCPRCGHEVPEQAKFCPDCGNRNFAGGTGRKKDDSARMLKILVGVLAVLVAALAAVVVLIGIRRVRGSGISVSEDQSGGAGTAVSQDVSEPDRSEEETSAESIAAQTVQAEDGNEETVVKTVAALPRPSFFRMLAEAAGVETSSEDTSSGDTAETQGADLTGRTDASYVTASIPEYTVASDLSNVMNLSDYYFTDEVKSALARNGFVIREGRDLEFFDAYENNRYWKEPNFVTVDSMMHTYHLYFAYLLKHTEKDHLTGALSDLSAHMLAKSLDMYTQLKGTEWENAAGRCAAFFGVGASLLGQDAQMPSELTGVVSQELSNINAASGIIQSPLTGAFEDYTQYIPRGYYEGDTALEAYFRCMMWYGRQNFSVSDEDATRSALLITLALDEETLPLWEQIYTVTSFFAGASDDCGYYEYRPALEEAYGANVSVSDLPENASAWMEFLAITDSMPSPKINSVPTPDDNDPETDSADLNKGFRFMGQRFSIDEAIFQNLVYERVKPNGDVKRMLPDALDVPAALGSDTAYEILKSKGTTDYPNFEEQLTKVRQNVETAPSDVWSASLYSRWLFTLGPLLEEKGSGYPMFMQTDAWTRKNLQTFLGSYTELKHDTVLYSKQIMVEMGGDLIEDKDDRGYVEPEPVLFARLAELVDATRVGLAQYGYLADDDAAELVLLSNLASSLEMMSQKELRNETLSDEEYELIRSYGGQIEHFWEVVCREEADSEYFSSREFPSALVVDIASNSSGETLEVATGSVSEIYCIVPVDGTLRIANGTVYSFYEFVQPSSERLTDTKWRQMQGLELDETGNYRNPEKETESWTRDFQIQATAY